MLFSHSLCLCPRPSLRLVVALAVAVVVGAGLVRAAPQNTVAPPVFTQQTLPDAVFIGQGQMRFLGLRIYDARLWSQPQFDAKNFDAYPLVLELAYHRAFTGQAIAQRSIHEIQRQGKLSPAQGQRWLQALAALLPDVQAGDRLTGLYKPGLGLRLWRGQQALGTINDAELARRFFGIWLSPRTSEPSLRSALLAGKIGMAP